MPTWSAGDVIANGIRIHYYRTGGGKPPVVLCHGYSDSGLCWASTARALQADYDVIMPDARGHGLSEAPEDAYSHELMAADLAGFIRALGLERPAVAGHSMGGYVAALAAAEYPGLMRCVTLEDPGWRPEAQLTVDELAARMQERKDTLQEAKAMSRDDLLARGQEQHLRWDETDLAAWADAKQQLSLNIVKSYGRRREAWQTIVPRITCPILLVRSDPALGGIVTAEMAAEAQTLWREGRVVHVPGAGHNVRRDQSEAFITAVRGFLAEQMG